MSSAATLSDIRPFRAPYAPEDAALVAKLLAETHLPESAERRIEADATRLIERIRADSGSGGVEDFLREYSLSTKEGLALMVLAEALLRVPDAETADRLIEDKLAEAHFERHRTRSDSWLVSATSWALGLTARIVHSGETPEGIIAGLVKRLGRPAVRTAARQAMRVLGHQFVLGETIEAALDRAREAEEAGYRHSYDMLGEGARTAADAARYFEAYARAIDAIGRSAGDKPLPARPGISIKLSALHPRYEAKEQARVMAELVPRLIDLARAAKDYDLAFTIDAEEADRLELSLDVIAAMLADPSLAGWGGFGLAVQAYQKRATAAIDWIGELAAARGRQIMVRLVKGAYWDTEIKRAQERGLPSYPVFTRKAATDLSYLACMRRLLAARPRLFPQFATHNALTVAEILELSGARDRRGAGPPGDPGFEFQRLHGMGAALYRALTEEDGFPCRVYAPVGGHRDLLAYLVRRLLENGANSSFVAQVGDPDVPIRSLLHRPVAKLREAASVTHPKIPPPLELFGAHRRNSRGVEFGYAADREALANGVAAISFPAVAARPIVGRAPRVRPLRPILSPVDGTTLAGTVVETAPEAAGEAMAAAASAFPAWSRLPVGERAAVLDRAADLIEAHRDELIALMAVEGGKTLADGVAEVREAADFCRYYAAEARALFGEERVLPGPTGEENRWLYRGRGVAVCISPWNFPLAIFLGQVAAALVAGNAVVAKPAEQTPLTAYRAMEILHEAGLPAGILQLLPGDGQVGAALVADPQVAAVAFTGSTETAWAINRALAARQAPIVPLIAETGGINAMIVDATALPEQVTDDVGLSAFRSAGQRCSALRLLLVQEDVAEDLIGMIVGAARELKLGDPRDLETDIGPVIDADAKRKLDAHLARMRREQNVLFSGEPPGGRLAQGFWAPPAVVRLDRAQALDQEIFGPILHVATWKAGDLDAVLDAVAATGYGLTLGIHSRIEATVRHVIERLAVGNIYVNRNMIGAVVGVQPFGGSGLSGTGPKAGGPDYLRRFALEQTISVNTAAAGGNASLIAMEE